MIERDAFDLRQAETYAQYLRDKMGEREPIERTPMPIKYEPLCPGSGLEVRVDIMVPCVGYDPKHHEPDTYYRLVRNPATDHAQLRLQSEIDQIRREYREQHGGA